MERFFVLEAKRKTDNCCSLHVCGEVYETKELAEAALVVEQMFGVRDETINYQWQVSRLSW